MKALVLTAFVFGLYYGYLRPVKVVSAVPALSGPGWLVMYPGAREWVQAR
jgi:hypothetical protein